MGMFIKPIFHFAVRKFVCTPGATTNTVMGVNTEYRAKLVKAMVNVPSALMVSSVSSISLKLFVQKLPYSSELYLK